MKVYSGLSEINGALRGAVLAVGNFDGVHLGHQRILRTSHALAVVSSAKVVVMTFEPHPLALLKPAAAPARLTPWSEKVRLLEHAGADGVIRLNTDGALLSLPAEEFVHEILVRRIHPSYIVEGPNFGFGKGRTGDVALLRKMSAKGGFQVHVVDPYRLTFDDGQSSIVSSTLVRQWLRNEQPDRAAACLGRPFRLIGKVVTGDKLGRQLGFPTINLDVGDQLVPADGVYAGTAVIDGRCKETAISIGTRPTMNGDHVVIEAYILDDAGDWYGLTASLDLIKYLRRQVRYDTTEALIRQIARDVEDVRAAIVDHRSRVNIS